MAKRKSKRILIVVSLLLLIVPTLAFLLYLKEKDYWANYPNFTERDWPDQPTGKTVEILKIDGQFQIYRDGEPYVIKGAAGRENLEALKKAGGNSIRTYIEAGLDTLLDRCQALDLSVIVGIYLESPRQYFDYKDQKAVVKQKERVLNLVDRYKDHPAVLAWALGNEVVPKITKKNTVCLKAINELASAIKQIDPNHLVTSIFLARQVFHPLVDQYCSALDLVAFNVFKPLRMPYSVVYHKIKNYKGPYLITEWGADGHWEVNPRLTQWGEVIEPSIEAKQNQVVEAYTNFILSESDRCLGHYVFYWGQKQEVTPTWFSLFGKHGEKTALVDALQTQWTGREPINKAPRLSNLKINYPSEGNYPFIPIGTEVIAEVTGEDPEGDTLHYEWEIWQDERIYDKKRAGVELEPAKVKGSFTRTWSNQISLKLPQKTGPYRLYVNAYDGNGNIAFINFPFYVTNNVLVADF